jgi:hypothetical protein
MITLDDLCASLLPPDDHIRFQSLIIDEPRLILVAAMISTNSTCPDCCQPTHRIHGHYQRTLADLPWATAPIELRVIVRRFRCPTCTCRRQTFAERLPSVAPLYARTSTRLATTQANTGLVLGGATGARHLSRHGSLVSRNTLLRTLAQWEIAPSPDLVADLTQDGLLACWTRRHTPHIENFPRYYAAMLRGLITQHCKRLQREQQRLRPWEEAGPCSA